MIMNLHASSLLVRVLALCLVIGNAAGQDNETAGQEGGENETITAAQEGGEAVLLWSSTGGGWRAMFADIGYANAFHQAGLMTANSIRFSQVSTVSGGSWFSTQLFYSQWFYDQTVLAENPKQLEQFVLHWMATYAAISTDISDETKAQCDTSDWGPTQDDFTQTMAEVCELLATFDFDWTIFIQKMLDAASTDYGDPTFIDTIASPENRIPVMSTSDLLIQAALVPTSRIRGPKDSKTTTAVYLGNGNLFNQQLFTVPLSAAFVIEDAGAGFVYGTEDLTREIHTYTGEVPVDHSWETWEPFFLYAGEDIYNEGTIEINNTAETIGQPQQAMRQGTFRTPYGGPSNTTVLQVASISSAAGGNGSPLVPTVYSQYFSTYKYTIDENEVRTLWRVLAGIAAGLGATLIIGFSAGTLGLRCGWCTTKRGSMNSMLVIGVISGALVGVATGILYGLGSILIPIAYDGGINHIYTNGSFDKFAVCSQWPNSCGEQDGFMIDGWFIDNPALVINVGHYQQKSTTIPERKLKVIITNCNEVWNDTFNYAQLLQYFSTYFNQDVPPGGYLFAPGYWAPYRSPQIFAEYLDERGIDALLEPIPNSNMTTAILTGTTVDNPSFGTKAGLDVEILLLNLNEDITTMVIGIDKIEELTQPLADMTVHIASSQELVQRIRDFAGT